jgi:hypothetical protein
MTRVVSVFLVTFCAVAMWIAWPEISGRGAKDDETATPAGEVAIAASTDVPVESAPNASTPGNATADNGAGARNATTLRPPPSLPAEYQEHLQRLAPKVPRGFSVIVQPPFVVIGNDVPTKVRYYARDVVAWATARLKRDYFSADPRGIVDVWLFNDDKSYERWRAKLFTSQPDTPYGYFSSRDRALVMNISTGRGTLVHEMVHAFVESNFPGCPAWFNEGLASLYEKPGEREGRLYGYTNWRLPDLQAAIRAGQTRSLTSLLTSNADQFYGDPNRYAQARYLCHYLQQRGVLRRFYRQFHDTRGQDPSGTAALLAVLGETDLAAFEQRWNKFVLDLEEVELSWRDGKGYQP